MFGLDVNTLRNIKETFAHFPHIEKVLIYGSRAKGNYRHGSDIDITLLGKNISEKNTIYPLRNQFDDLGIPYSFDISVFDRLDSPDFISHILRVGKVMYQRSDEAGSGNVPERRIFTLGELATVSAGNSAPQDKALFQDGQHPFIRTADVGKIRFGTIESTSDYLNEAGIAKLRCFPQGTILLPKSGASTFLNHRVMMGVKGYVSSHLATVQADKKKVLSRFLLYFLHTVRAQDLVQDQSYPSLNLPLIESIQISLPPLLEQKRIVVFLDKLSEAKQSLVDTHEKKLGILTELKESLLHKAFIGDLAIDKSVTDRVSSGIGV